MLEHRQLCTEGEAYLREMFPGEGWIHLLLAKPGDHPFAVGPFSARSHPFAETDFLPSLARSAVDTSAKGYNVWVCPYPHLRAGRRKGEALERLHVHADVDGPHFEDRARALGAMVVESGGLDEGGTPKTHLYLRLSESVSPAQHKALCAAFGEQVGGEHWDPSKRLDNDVLRLPGTLNWKDPANPRPVRLATSTVRTWTPQRLADLLGVDLEKVEKTEKLWEQPRTRAKGWGASEATLARLLGELGEARRGNRNSTLFRVAREAAAFGAPESFKQKLIETFAALPSREGHLSRLQEGRRTAERGWGYGRMRPKVDTTGLEIVLED